MERMKTFFTYILIGILFFLYSNFMINLGMKAIYRTIPEGTITSENIKVTEAKATYVNGYIEGVYTNNLENKLGNDEYIKIDIYSKRNILLTTKFIKLDELEPNATQNFRIAYKATDTNRFVIGVADEESKKELDELKLFSEETTKTWLLKTLIIVLIFK